MKKLLPLFIIFIFAVCQDILELQSPESYISDTFEWEKSFTGFWTGMNNNYVFWDIDPTDWDAVYREYRPKFIALDNLEISNNEKWEIAGEYFKKMTENLIDGHFGLMLESGLVIIPSYARYFAQFGADYYNIDTWNDELLQSDLFAERFDAGLADAVKNYNTVEFHQYTVPNDDAYKEMSNFSVAVGKIPFDENGNNILYFYLSNFYLELIFDNSYNFLPPNFDEHKDALINIVNIFFDNMHAPDVLGIIIDVRGNTGGYFGSFFWGRMFTEQRRQIGWQKQKMGDGRLDFSPLLPFYIYSDRGARNLNVPLVLLTNSFSVSASEIGALFVRTLPNGFIVGGTTFGAHGPIGDAHDVWNAGNFSTLGITETYTPFLQMLDLNKESFEGRGIPPDYPVPFDYQSFSNGIDARLEKAIEVIKSSAF